MKYIILSLIALSASACASTGHHITDSKSAWINIGHGPKTHVYWCEAKEGQKPACEKPDMKP